MLKKLFLSSMFLVGLTAMSFAAVGGDSKYVKLYVFDAGGGPVTPRTTRINAFVDFIDMTDYTKSEGFPANSLLTVTQSTGINPPLNPSYFVNDLQNSNGIIQQIKVGDMGPNGYTINTYGGNMSVYLGEYSILPSQSRYFNGGIIVQFNFTVTSPGVTGSKNIYASQVVPFYIYSR